MQAAMIDLQKENPEPNHLQVAYHLINDHKLDTLGTLSSPLFLFLILKLTN